VRKILYSYGEHLQVDYLMYGLRLNVCVQRSLTKSLQALHVLHYDLLVNEHIGDNLANQHIY